MAADHGRSGGQSNDTKAHYVFAHDLLSGEEERLISEALEQPTTEVPVPKWGDPISAER